MFRKIIVYICLFTFLFLLPGCSRKEVVLRFNNPQWESIQLCNAIAKFIIENGYDGYRVEMIALTSKEVRSALENGEVDLRMEDWKHYQLDWYNRNIQEGNIINLGLTFENTYQAWIIPQWVAEKYEIKTVFDMQEHWLLFQDPNDQTKGAFYNCVIGWDCKETNEIKLQAYGLDKFYNAINPGSPEALVQTFTEAQENHIPIFGYYWAPSPIIGAYDWYILEEPVYEEYIWDQIIAAAKNSKLRPVEKACAYNRYKIEKIAHKSILKKAPRIVEVLKKMNFGTEPLNKTLGWMIKNNISDYDEAAIYYLEHNEGRWKTWVDEKAYKKIKAALEEK